MVRHIWWYCNICPYFRRASALAAQHHADTTGHSLHQGTKVIRPSPIAEVKPVVI